MKNWCHGCCRDFDECECEKITPALVAELLAPLKAHGINPAKKLGPQLGLDTREGLSRVTKRLGEPKAYS